MNGYEEVDKSTPVVDWVRKVFRRYNKRTENQSGNRGNQAEPSGKTGSFHIPPAYLLDSEVKSMFTPNEKPSGGFTQSA